MSSIKDRFTSFVGKLRKKVSKENEEEIEANEVIDNLISQTILTVDERLLSGDIKNQMIRDGNEFNKIGFGDGVKGIEKTSITKIASVKVNFIRDHVKANFSGKRNALQTELKLKDEVKNRRKKESDSQDKYRDELLDYSRKYPKQHSWILFVIYMFIAFCLILADIPLALELTQLGFQLPTSGGAEEAVIRLFENPIAVFIANWETFLLSFGIALCTIYIKILYDEFLGSPIHNKIIKYKNIPGVDYNSPDEIKEIKKEDTRRKRIKLFIFFFTILTIICLGVFRFEVISSNPDIYEGMPTTLIVRFTFIFITILFPLIGGVCFSISLSNLQNIHSLRAAKRNSQVKHKSFLKALREYSNTEKQFDDIDGFVNDWSTSESSQGYVQYLTACYDYGYNHGQMEADHRNPLAGLMERTEKLRNNVVSRNVFSRIDDNNRALKNGISNKF